MKNIRNTPSINLNVNDRKMMIEWLYVITGLPKDFWSEYDNYRLQKVYNLNVEENGYEAIEK